MLSLALNTVPDTWQTLKYFKWMLVMINFVFSLHLSWILVPFALGYQIGISNSINPDLKFFLSGLPSSLLSYSLPCFLPFFLLSLIFPSWNCYKPYYLHHSVIRFYQFCFLTVFDSITPFFHSCFISGLLSLSNLSVTEPSNLFLI